MRVDLGCGQITWRGRRAQEALADIGRAGYRGAPWSYSYGETPSRITETLREHGLLPAPAYFGGDFWEPARYENLVAAADRYAKTSRALGVTELYISAGGFQTRTRAGRTRWQAAAKAGPDDELTDTEFTQLVRTVTAIGTATLEHGVRACYHNHVGSFVETEHEVERLLAETDPEVVFLGPDTGHLAWAGIDPVAFTRRHRERIRTMHLKDMVEAVRTRGIADGWDYTAFEQHGIWTEVGDGDLDVRRLLQALEDADFDGWLIVETDVTRRESPYQSARISREYLNSLGL